MRSYSDLCNDVTAFLNRKDLADQIPRFIMLAEQDLFRRLRATCNETIVSYTPESVGYPINAVMRLPDSAIELKTVLFDGTPLQYISDAEYFRRLKGLPPVNRAIPNEDWGWLPTDDDIAAPMDNVTQEDPPEVDLDRHAYPPWLTPKQGHYLIGSGQPEFFTRIQNYICLWPICDHLDNEAHISMYSYDGPIDSVNQYSNTLQDAYPAYLYGALCHAEGYLLNDPRIALWKSKFEEVLAQMNGTKTDADLGSVQEVMGVYQ